MDNKRHELKVELEETNIKLHDIVAELAHLRTRVATIQTDKEHSSCENNTNLASNEYTNNLIDTKQHADIHTNSQPREPSTTMKTRASTVTKSRPLIIHDSIGKQLHGRRLLPGLPAQKRWAPTFESASDLMCEIANANTTPECIILMVGTRNLGEDNVSTFKEKLNILCQLTSKSPSTKVFMCTLLPRRAEKENDKIKAANRILREICLDNGIYVIDTFTPFLDQVDSWFTDQLHPNHGGLVCIVQKIRQALETTGVYIRKEPHTSHRRNSNNNIRNGWSQHPSHGMQTKAANRAQSFDQDHARNTQHAHYPHERRGYGFASPPNGRGHGPPPPFHYPAPPSHPAYTQGNFPHQYQSSPWGMPPFPWPNQPGWPVMH